VPDAQSQTEPDALTDDRCQDAPGRHRRGRVICRHLPSSLPGAGWFHRKHDKAPK